MNASAQCSTDVVFSDFPRYTGDDLELKVDSEGTHFTLWSPASEAVRVMLYDQDRNSKPTDTLMMTKSEHGTWTASVPGQLYGKFYTFQIKDNGTWLSPTPGIWAKAVGTNGERAAIIDFSSTNHQGWQDDKGP
ncbi:MAG: type I pullulanase, partial [Muribaculaceae bacterium]|nr:type I pullulanase [Muribaculaceae bacterium]